MDLDDDADPTLNLTLMRLNLALFSVQAMREIT